MSYFFQICGMPFSHIKDSFSTSQLRETLIEHLTVPNLTANCSNVGTCILARTSVMRISIIFSCNIWHFTYFKRISYSSRDYHIRVTRYSRKKTFRPCQWSSKTELFLSFNKKPCVQSRLRYYVLKELFPSSELLIECLTQHSLHWNNGNR